MINGGNFLSPSLSTPAVSLEISMTNNLFGGDAVSHQVKCGFLHSDLKSVKVRITLPGAYLPAFQTFLQHCVILSAWQLPTETTY